MSALSIQPTYPIFTDIDGQPLEDGFVWIGQANLDPQGNPISVYWDAALTIPATQPIRTRGGYPVNSGTPARLYVNSDYSIRVMNKNGSVVYSAPAATERYNGGVISTIDATQVTTTAVGSAVQQTQQAYNNNAVYATQYGVVGNGIADDTAALQEALNEHKHVIIPAGLTPLISASITVPSRTRLEFMGGLGNLPGAMPASYLIKKSTMTTPAIIISERGTVDGGGVLGQPGNTGDGVQLAGNSATLRNHIVCQIGRDGVRVGTDGVYANCNSTVIEYVKAKNNGRYGFYVHDGVGVGPANANAGTLLQCEADANGADGIRLGHCFWVSVINCLTEVNTAYGLYLSGIDNGTYPECRWATILGGDFNEGNNGTSNVDQVYDSSYFSTFVNADPNQFPTNTTTTGLQGAGVRSQYGGPAKTSFYGGTFYTGSANQYPLVIDALTSGVTFNSLTLQKKTTGSNGNGVGLGFSISSGGANPYLNAGEIQVTQNTTDQYGMTFNVYRAGALPALEINANAYAVRPRADNTWANGWSSLRWSVVYAATGTINTSDAREKQQVRTLNDAEKAVAVKLKSLVRAFKFNDAVEKKGDTARIHFGVMAQEVKSAFESEGLVAEEYAMLCYDEWEDQFEPVYEIKEIEDEQGNKVQTKVDTGEKKLVTKAGNRYGVRYEELLAFIISAM